MPHFLEMAVVFRGENWKNFIFKRNLCRVCSPPFGDNPYLETTRNTMALEFFAGNRIWHEKQPDMKSEETIPTVVTNPSVKDEREVLECVAKRRSREMRQAVGN
jgi:hypothetical protein